MKQANPWVQTATGRAFDLMAPTADMVDFNVDLPEALARTARFCGAVLSGPYSVAQHSVVGADAIMRETGRLDLAAAFLLHDGHEYVLGDLITPAAQALARYAGACGACGAVNGIMKDMGSFTARTAATWCVDRGIDLMKQSVDTAIYGAAGIDYPLPADVAAAVKDMDLRMLATERRYLLAPAPGPWSDAVEHAAPLRLVGKLRVWPWPEAADEFRDRLKRYIPQLDVRHTTRPKKRKLPVPRVTPTPPL
jgi:5'-deoxynucleotidase YfbR-like HD superfamily hydrolase